MSSRRVLFPGLVAALGFGIVACGTSSGSPEQAGSGEPSSVAVEAAEYKFAPDSITIPAGEVTFSVKNVGELEHEFEIFKGEQVIDEVEGLVPGLSRDLTVTLEPGDYTYVCKLAGHEEAGMSGALTVTE